MPGVPDRMLILLADDDEDDRVLIEEALKDSQMRARLRTVEDGEELLDYLKRRGEYGEGEVPRRPELVLLDLNMPRVNGHEALERIKQDPELRSIPVIVFTTSTSEDDVERSYDAGCNTYITKPRSYPDLIDVMKTFSKYWSATATLPPPAAA
jgi:CheY-like chemotaxis protein